MDYGLGNDQLNVKWDWDNKFANTGFKVEVVSTTDSNLSVTQTVDKPDALACAFDYRNLGIPAGTYTAKIQAIAAATDLSSEVGTSKRTIQKLAAPALDSVSFNHNMVLTSWASIPNTSYTLKLIEGTKTKLLKVTSCNTSPIRVGTTLTTIWGAGTTQVQVQANQNTTAIPSDWSAPKSVEVNPLTLDALAKKMKKDGVAGGEAAKILVQVYSNLAATNLANATTLVKAMAGGKYLEKETVAGLKKVYPTLKPGDLVSALDAGYAKETPAEFAKDLLTNKKVLDGKTAAQDLMANFPNLTAKTLAQAMAEGGYLERATVMGLKAVFSKLSAPDLVAALNAAYAKETAAEFVKNLLKNKKVQDGKTAAQKLMANFPNLTAKTLADAMTQGGYSHQAIKNGIKAIFPKLNQGDINNILQ